MTIEILSVGSGYKGCSDLPDESRSSSASSRLKGVRQYWTTDSIGSGGSDDARGFGDLRNYPASHDKYDLARLSEWGYSDPGYREKAARKYDVESLALMTRKDVDDYVESFGKLGGLPGFIDAFLRGEPGGRGEGYAKYPAQFRGTRFDSAHGGFLISMNPSNADKIGKTYTDDAATLLERTKDSTGFGLVCFWIPPCAYERYPMFQVLFPNTPIPPDAPERAPAIDTELDRQDRLQHAEDNEAYRERTGIRFLANPIDLGREHVPLLQELKAAVFEHLKSEYKCDPGRHEVKIYSHGPFYMQESGALHFHVRVCEKIHPLEFDLRSLHIDEIIGQLSESGTLKYPSQLASGSLIAYKAVSKSGWADRSGFAITPVPNPWRRPARRAETGVGGVVPIDRSMIKSKYVVPDKSAKKYDAEKIALLSGEALQRRLDRYLDNTILPNFIYDFFVNKHDGRSGSDRSSEKYEAFLRQRDQFAATSYDAKLGSMLLMPNKQYTDGKAECYVDPGGAIERRRASGGIALVGYWLPPGVFEGLETFKQVFGGRSPGLAAPSSPGKRETVAQYNARMGEAFIVNPVDVRPCHLPMLREFKKLALTRLEEVYGMDPNKDRVQMYLHGPIYGSKTAGLHVHVRVNQGLPAGEEDVTLNFDQLLKILEASSSDREAHDRIRGSFRHTSSGTHILYSPVWGPQQFEGIELRYVDNPWRRPSPSLV